ncbi:hypothetical protein K492DRAFT_204955 [Lichtheimia hyalospora FSU 10163]|nr:hypothetical protein K492DRAFT_204955 [Lichtheimia hyalospora FSU 10163]
MSKRQADAEPESSTGAVAVRAKRARSSQKEGHVEECTDPECQGCDVGEIEISFVRKDEQGNEHTATPSAQELLDMAMTEASQNSKQRDDHLVRRLFDLALEQYQEKEADDRIGYATCLIELGRAIHVEESLREGLDILRGLDKKQSLDDQQQLLLARAAMDLAIFIRKRQNALYEEMWDSEDQDEEEQPSEEMINKQKVTREEIKLCKDALDAIDKVLPSLDKSPTKQVRSTLENLHAYAQLLDQPIHFQHISLVLDALVRYIQHFTYQEDPESQALWAASLLHKQKFIQDTGKQQDLCDEIEKLISTANKIYKEQNKQEYARGMELLAMLQLTQSNLLEDEDAVLDKYDEAIASFKRALELNPDNQDLQDMVNMLTGENEE